MPLPVWLIVLMLGVALTPVVNLLAFIIGAIVYLICIVDCEIVFYCGARWWKSIKGFLCKEV